VALQFVRTSSERLISDDTSISWGIGTGNYTFAWWATIGTKVSAYSAMQSFGTFSPSIYSHSTTSNAWRLYHAGDKVFDTVLGTGTTYHLACRRTGTGAGGLQGFVDGVEEATTHTHSQSIAEETWNICSSTAGGSEHGTGTFSEFGVWDTDLDDEEIAALAAGFAPSMVRPSNLVGYLPMIRDEYRDVTGVGAFTANGTPDIADHPRIIYPPPKVVVPVESGAAPPATAVQDVVSRGVIARAR
jgi:hypothetical protein